MILLLALFTNLAFAKPADFTGTYTILQSRTLGLSFGRGYVIQDGYLVLASDADASRPYCRSAQSKFDDYAGSLDVVFQTAANKSEHAILTSIPSAAGSRPTTIECIATGGFSSELDLAIALGRIVELVY